MRQITLGRTKAVVSAISLGTWSYGGENTAEDIPVGWAGQTEDDSQKALLKCWEVGVNHWDTADVYGDGRSEEVIGSVWGSIPRDEIFLATKSRLGPGQHNYWYNVESMRNNMERSLKTCKQIALILCISTTATLVKTVNILMKPWRP